MGEFIREPKIHEMLKIIDRQSGYFSVMYFLFTHKKAHIVEMSGVLGIGNRTLYKIFEILTAQALIHIKEERGDTKAMRKNYYLTDKGKNVALKMVEMVNVIRDRSIYVE